MAEQRVTNSQSYYYFAPVEFAFFLPLHLDLQHPGVGSARKCLSDPRIPFICGPRESEGPESKNGGDALDVDILCSVFDKVYSLGIFAATMESAVCDAMLTCTFTYFPTCASAS